MSASKPSPMAREWNPARFSIQRARRRLRGKIGRARAGDSTGGRKKWSRRRGRCGRRQQGENCRGKGLAADGGGRRRGVKGKGGGEGSMQK